MLYTYYVTFRYDMPNKRKGIECMFVDRKAKIMLKSDVDDLLADAWLELRDKFNYNDDDMGGVIIVIMSWKLLVG